jgi:uncharacterized OB-fold protein
MTTSINNQTKGGKKMVPLVEGLYKLASDTDKESHLIGRRCLDCGTYFYPNTGHQKTVCSNCFGRNLEEAALSHRGTLYSYALCNAVADFVVVKPPFAIGTILLPKENVLVWTVSTADTDLNSLKVDMDVDLVFVKVKEDKAGNDVMAFEFKPI